MSTRITALPLLLLASFAFAGDDSTQTQPPPAEQQVTPPQQNSGDKRPQSSVFQALGRALFGKDAFDQHKAPEQPNQNDKPRPTISASDAAAHRERAIYSTSQRTGMTEDQVRRALFYWIPDNTDSNWKWPVAPTTRKANLLGRPSTFSIEQGLSLFENYVIDDWGRMLRPFQLLENLAQIVADASWVACVPDTQGQQRPDYDILCFATMPIQVTIPRQPNPLRLTGHTDLVWRILMSTSGQRLVSCSDDGTIRLWDIWSLSKNVGKQIAQFPGYPRDGNQVVRGEFAAFSPYGHWLATVHEHRVSFHSPKTGQTVFEWEPDLPGAQRIMALRFDSNGNNLLAFLEHAVETKTPEIKFFQYDIDERQERPFVGTHAVVDGRSLGDGQYVVTWDGSPELIFWDVAERKEVTMLQVAPEHVYDVAVSPNGDVIATAGDDGEVKFWKAKSWDQPEPQRLETKTPFKHDGVDLVQFARYGKQMITGSDDGWLRYWEAPDFWNKPDAAQPIFSSEKKDRDGTTRTQFTDGGYEERHRDGTIKRVFPDGRIKIYKQQ